jgi:hypothetical protein
MVVPVLIYGFKIWAITEEKGRKQKLKLQK